MVDVSLPAISVSHVSVVRAGRRVIGDLSFHVEYASILAILGPNGAGKSSLLRAISGLLPCSGEIRVAGELLTSLSDRDRATRLAFVPQTPALHAALTVREVVSQGRYVHARGLGRLSAVDHAAISSAMRRTDVTRLAERTFPTLSRGEQQRVMLARALCTEARILCLDEPTASLDVAHALELYELLRALRQQGYALVVVLHQLADALRFSDRALMLSSAHPARIGLVTEVIQQRSVNDVYGVSMRANAGLEFDRIAAGRLDS